MMKCCDDCHTTARQLREDTDAVILVRRPATIKGIYVYAHHGRYHPWILPLRSSDGYASTSFPIAALSFKKICEP